MASTIIEKIMERVTGEPGVETDDVVVCEPDQMVLTDQLFAVEGVWYDPLHVVHPDRISIIFDHAVPAPTIIEADAMIRGRALAEKWGIRLVDVGAGGIGHQVLAEQGLALPGQLLVSVDSHACAGGAFNCAARGIGPVDMMHAVTKGTTWFTVSPTIRYELCGELPDVVTGKDAFFAIAQNYGGHSGMNMEFGGEGLATLSLSQRRTIATMCAEVSADFAIFEHDEVLDTYLDGRAQQPYEPVNPDPGAEYEAVRTLDLSTLEPYVIFPDSVPNNGTPISALKTGIKIDQAFVGSCANGKLDDLRLAARMVEGRKVAPGVRFLVTPASQAVYLEAVREGIVETLVEAGAVVTNSACGACYGGTMGLVGAGEVCLTASTRNFKGRMGSSDAQIYMGSPATVAASAIAGEIVDPRLR